MYKVEDSLLAVGERRLDEAGLNGIVVHENQLYTGGDSGWIYRVRYSKTNQL